MNVKTLHEWPYKNGPEFMTPDVVWSAYLHADRLRRLWEIELAHCAARIHNQREEIKRLAAEVERLKPKPRGPAHSCDIPGCAVCDYTAGL